MSKKNYAKKTSEEFNILTRLYQFYAIYIVFAPFLFLFYKLKSKKYVKLDKNKNYLVAPNHISYLDPVLTSRFVGRRMGFMAKKELFEGSWWLKKNISRLGGFAVNREHVEPTTIKSAFATFRAKWDLCIFPQGGIRKNKKLEKINSGFIMIAKKMNADILPVSISGVEEYNWNLFNKKTIEVNVGEPISYKLSEDEIINLWKKRVGEMSGYEVVYSE